MAKGYWIGRLDVTDPEGYKPYMTCSAAIFATFGGRFIVRGGKYQSMEGASRARNVVVEFPDYQSALDLLPLAGIPGVHEGASGACRGRCPSRRGLRPGLIVVQIAAASR